MNASKDNIQYKQALNLVVSKTGMGVYASADKLFKGAVFGRDSLEVGEDLLPYAPRLVKNILMTVAALQGIKYDLDNEEEPGKIHHEYRSSTYDGHPLDATSQGIFDRLTHRWGGNDKELRYYGSVDATPLFVRLLCRYAKRYGKGILNTKITRYEGSETTLQAVLNDAAVWMMNNIDTSPFKMVSYKALNARGIENQVWKDSIEFYVHPNGQLANHKGIITSIEVQGYAYDALVMAAEYLPSLSLELQNHASQLRTQVIAMLWMDDFQYFALGLDQDEDGNPRAIRTLSANPGTLLDSLFFKGLPTQLRIGYISGIVRRVCGKDFMTDAGIRSRALSQTELIPFWDYHGGCTTWPKETYDISKGLRRQGFVRLAQQLENRLVNIVRRTGHYPEFIYIDSAGRVLLDELNGPKEIQKIHHLVVKSTNHPERWQAWTISAIVAIELRLPTQHIRKLVRITWQSKLESLMLAQMNRIPIIKDRLKLHALYPTFHYTLKMQQPIQGAQLADISPGS